MKTTETLEKPLDWFLFNSRIAKGLCRVIKRNADVLSKKYDVPLALKVSKLSVDLVTHDSQQP